MTSQFMTRLFIGVIIQFVVIVPLLISIKLDDAIILLLLLIGIFLSIYLSDIYIKKSKK